MKNILIFFCLLASSMKLATACTITFVATPEIKQAIQYQGFRFANFSKICADLNKANARIIFGGGFYTVDGRNVSSISAQLLDLKLPIASINYTSSAVVVDEKADDRNRLSSLNTAVNHAMKLWVNIDDSINELNASRRMMNVK